MTRTYDRSTYELACVFLTGTKIDNEEHRAALANHLQSEIEDWITFEEEEVELERKRSEAQNK